jgi:Do/DeqQ family serine protease
MHSTMSRRSIPATLIAFAALTITVATGAALPAEVNGQPLPSLAPLIHDVNPAVVNIAVRSTVAAQANPFWDQFFGRRGAPQQRETQAAGSGVIVDAAAGLIMTNHHVVNGATEINVTLHDQRSFTAVLVGSDEASDVALIRIDADDLHDIDLGNSDTLEVGDFVIAIGNPFGFSHTVTSGIVSGKGRFGLNRESYEDFIQTDAAINPGNSGGALVNLRGELVGINSAIFTGGTSAGNIGIGFAIPVNMARAIMDQLVEFGDVRRGLLGVSIQGLTPQLAEEFDVPANHGAVVTQVTPGSAADEAGIEEGDVIVAVNGDDVRDHNDLRNTIGLTRTGEELDLTVIRRGDRVQLAAMIEDPRSRTLDRDESSPLLAGGTFSDLDERAVRRGLSGVLLLEVEPGSLIAREGLRPGDIITSVNREDVNDLTEFEALTAESSRLLLNIRRGDGALFIVLRGEGERRGSGNK